METIDAVSPQPEALPAQPVLPAPPVESLEPVRQLPRPAARPAREKSSLRRRALLGAAGLAGFTALSRLARAGELAPPPGPVGPSSFPTLGQLSTKLDQGSADLQGQLGEIKTQIAFTPQGISEPRTPIASLPSSADAQFVISKPGAYCLTTNVEQVASKVCIDIQTDRVDIDCQGFVFLGGGGGGGSSCIRASGREAIELYDCTFSEWHGTCCDFRDCDDVHLSDIHFHACVSPADPIGGSTGAIVHCRDRAVIEDVAYSKCVGRPAILNFTCEFLDARIIDNTGGPLTCGDGTCVEDCRFVRVSGSVLVTGGASYVCDCECRQCEGLAIATGPGSVVEGCDVTGGTGGGIHCDDGSCIDDCTVVNRDALAIECGSRCSVSNNHVVRCWGISFGSECACCDNDLSSCDGAPDAAEGLGGALMVTGAFCTCEDNWISSSRVGISVHAGGSSSLVHSNMVTGAGASSMPGAPGGAGIVIHDAARSVLCTCNHVQALQGAVPYAMGTAAFGPIVPAVSGDLSAVPSSSHPLANTAS